MVSKLEWSRWAAGSRFVGSKEGGGCREGEGEMDIVLCTRQGVTRVKETCIDSRAAQERDTKSYGAERECDLACDFCHARRICCRHRRRTA